MENRTTSARAFTTHIFVDPVTYCMYMYVHVHVHDIIIIYVTYIHVHLHVHVHVGAHVHTVSHTVHMRKGLGIFLENWQPPGIELGASASSYMYM